MAWLETFYTRLTKQDVMTLITISMDVSIGWNREEGLADDDGPGN